MILILIFLILTPGLISLLIHRLINKNNKTLETIATYCIYTFFIILVMYIFAYFTDPTDSFNLSINNESDLYSVSSY